MTKRSRLTVTVSGTPFIVDVESLPTGEVQVRVDGRAIEVDGRLPTSGAGSLLIDGASYLVDLGEAPGTSDVIVNGEAFDVQVEDGSLRRRGVTTDGGPRGGQRLVAPMPGKVTAVVVGVGQRVEPGTALVVLEAMKMENEFRATATGVVTEIRVAPGQAVNAGDLLVVID